MLTYRQTQWLLQQEGSAAIIFAGAWCGNTQASLRLVNDYAVADDAKVYYFDFRLDGRAPSDFWGYGRDRQFFIRSSTQGAVPEGAPESSFAGANNPFAYLYNDLVNTYLTNVETVTDPASDGYWITYATEEGEQSKAPKLQQPYLLAYNKDALDEDGFIAPVLAWHEEMLEISESSLERGTYLYQEDNYASYAAGVERVLQALDQSVGHAYTAFDGEPHEALVEPVVRDAELADGTAPAEGTEKDQAKA